MCGSFGEAVTKGLQQSPLDPRYVQAVVTLKHFDANSLEGDWGPGGSLNRHTVDSKISAHDLATSYLPAFKQAVEGGGALGVMCSYNAINGVPSCANEWLLGHTLRGEWKFGGYVTSDSGAVVDIFKSHHFTSNWTSTVSAAIKAGCDVESAPWPSDHAYGTGGPYVDYAPAAVRSGELPSSALDDALRHTLSLRFRLGLFDPTAEQPLWKVPPSTVQAQAHVDAAVDATEQSLVLLLNGGGVAGARAPTPARTAAPVLPFKAGGGRVAVVGPHANDHDTLLGNYLGQICPDGFSSRACVESPFEAIRAINGAAGTVNATGCAVNSSDRGGFDAAIAAARGAAAVVFVGGLDVSSVEREGKDRHEVGLPGQQPSLLRTLLALGKPTAVVLFHGGIVTFPPDILDAPNLAVVSAGYPGLYGAGAIARALFDRPSAPATNRWGKAPVTWYSERGWADAGFDMLSFDMAKAPGRTHRYYTGTPQWPFGHGLSYATTSIRARPEPGGAITVALRNEDEARDTDEVLLLLVSPAPSTVPAAAPASALRRTLAAFRRVGPIAAGATVEVSFAPTPDMVRLHDAEGKPVLHEGAYDFVVSTGTPASERRLRYECSAARCQAVPP